MASSFPRLFLCLAPLLATTALAFHWLDCASDPKNAAFTFHNFKVWPVPAIIPGDVHFSVELTVNRRIPQLFIDEDVDERTIADTFHLPCLGEGIGSCNNIDSCRYQELNIPEIWEKFMFYLLGNESVCPVQSKSVLIQDEIIHFPSIPPVLASFQGNNFTFRLHFKDGNGKKEHIGCIEFDFEFLLKKQGINGDIGRRDIGENVDKT